MEYVASLSGGKDSLAMVLRLMEEGRPLTKVVNFDEGMNFKAVSMNVEKARNVIEGYGAELVLLEPKESFLMQMMAKPVMKDGRVDHYGYGWCGATVRWMTSCKTQAINEYKRSIGDHIEYVGIAFDEQHRARPGKVYPLIEWGMTEKDCLAYCRERGWSWPENGVDLYDVLDRASCWCCRNKNLKELRAMRKSLPFYWDRLKGLQSKIEMPYRRDGATVFELDERFEAEDRQQSLF